jgi:1-acyl-sn-glycerol-3-phosphate acyltransferase
MPCSLAEPVPATLRAAHRVAAPLLRGGLRLTVTGQGQIPGSGGVLLAANHRSALDHFVLAAASPRPIRFLGKVELARGVGGRLHLMLGMVPVQRGTGDLRVIEQLAGMLHSGQVVGIFPEGSRSRTGELGRFRSGLSRLAAAAQVPVVPVALLGTAQVWPLGVKPVLRRPPRGLVQARIGDLLEPPAPDGRSRRAFTDHLQQVMVDLCGQSLAAGFTPVD